MLFDECWKHIKSAEARGELTVEDALDVATRLPQALYVSMMEALVEAGEDPAIILVQVVCLHDVTVKRLRGVVEQLRPRRKATH